MPEAVEIPADEYGLVRLFSTELDPPEAAAITAHNVHRLLGKDLQSDPSKIQVIPSKSIADLGLTAFLIDAYGIAAKDLAGKSAALDALTGLIILIPTSAFKGLEQTLEPNPALRFIGVFKEEAAKAPAPIPTPNTATDPPLQMPAPTPLNSPRTRSWIGAFGALIVAAGIILLIAL